MYGFIDYHDENWDECAIKIKDKTTLNKNRQLLITFCIVTDTFRSNFSHLFRFVFNIFSFLCNKSASLISHFFLSPLHTKQIAHQRTQRKMLRHRWVRQHRKYHQTIIRIIWTHRPNQTMKVKKSSTKMDQIVRNVRPIAIHHIQMVQCNRNEKRKPEQFSREHKSFNWSRHSIWNGKHSKTDNDSELEN